MDPAQAAAFVTQISNEAIAEGQAEAEQAGRTVRNAVAKQARSTGTPETNIDAKATSVATSVAESRRRTVAKAAVGKNVAGLLSARRRRST